VRFEGTKLADVSSRSNSGGRWTEITIFRTKGGRWIAQIVGRTQWQGEHDRHAVKIVETEAELVEALRDEYEGHLGWLAKEALEAAGIDTAEEIG
jgi:plasmid replication initiation protein